MATSLPADSAEHRQDWGDAPDTLGFVGRAEELRTLRTWIVEERCRLVALLGMGGIGKTSVATRLAHDVASGFERVYWRSLRDAPPVSDWLSGVISFLSDQQFVPPVEASERMAALLQLLRERRCLLVLDNFETLFQPGHQGLYRPGLDGYGHLLLAVGEAAHQSCLVLTSREAPEERAVFHGGGGRTFHLGGLGVEEAQVLLAPKQLVGTSTQWTELVARFGGNSLALKLVGETIRELFSAEIASFLEETGAGGSFGSMGRLLAEQVERSSPPEQHVLRLLAVAREPVTLAELLRTVGSREGRGAVLEAVEALRRRSLVDRAETPGAPAFTLQSVVLEYMTDQLVEAVADEIERGQPWLLLEQPLIHAQAKEYVRQSQERLIGAPLLQRLQDRSGSVQAEASLVALLEGWRDRPPEKQGYGPGTVVNLLRLMRGELRGRDLSRLRLRQAYLAEVEAQDATLADTHLAESVLAGAFDFPTSVALSVDGALLVAGTSTGEVGLWQVADRTPLWAVQGHSGTVWSVALSAGGNVLASGGGDGTVRLWETGTGQARATLRGHTGAVWSVALSADGHLLASSGADGVVRLWSLAGVPGGERSMLGIHSSVVPPSSGLVQDTSTARLLATLQGHISGVRSVALSADGHLLASGGADGVVRLWDTSTARPLATLQGHTGMVYGIALSADTHLLASGGADGVVRLWDTTTARPLAALQAHVGPVLGLALSAEGQLLASSGRNGTVRLWETSTARPLATLQSHTGVLLGLALSADGQLLASGAGDGTVRLWETSTARPLATLQGHTGMIYGVALSADGQLLASGGGDGTIWLWEASTGRALVTLQGHTGMVYWVALSADGELLASGGGDGTARLWETRTGRPLAILQGHSGGVSGVALSAAGHQVATGGNDGTVRLWETSSGRPLATLQGHTGMVYGVALSSDGHLIASGATDGTVRLWEASTGRPLAILRGHTGTVFGVALSADGYLLASGSGDGTVRLWETSTGRPLATLQGHTGMVYAVALSADGRVLASSREDGTVRLWDTSTRRPLATLQGHSGMVLGVALSASGQLLASGAGDATARLWDVRTGACLLVLRPERRYERLDITGLTGVTVAQRAALLALGAVEHHGASRDSRAPVPLDSVG